MKCNRCRDEYNFTSLTRFSFLIISRSFSTSVDFLFQRYVSERTSQNNEQQQQRAQINSGIMVANNGSIVTNGNMSIGRMITLNIHVLRENINQAMQFDVQMFVGDVLRSIQGHLPIRIDQDRKKRFCKFSEREKRRSSE